MKPSFFSIIALATFLVSVAGPVPALAGLTNDPFLGKQSSLEIVNAYDGWDIATDSADVVVAVIDSGVDIRHEDLRDNVWINPRDVSNGVDDDGNGYVDDVNGWDFLENSNDVLPKGDPGMPENSIGLQHGTGVAGILGAMGDNAKGIAGITWNVKIMSLRVLNQFGMGDSEVVTEAMKYAVRNGADVINLSLVGTDVDQAFIDALDEAHKAGIIVVAAAGNSGLNLNNEKDYPVCYDQNGPATVIGVGAIDDDFNRPSFSNYGDDCIDIVAPGVKIFTTRFVKPNFNNQERYAALFSGTSFAAPHVTGAIALLKGLRPSLTAQQALFVLQEGSTRIDENLHVIASGFNYALNLAGALHVLQTSNFEEPLQPITPAPPAPPSPAELLVYPRGSYTGTSYVYQFPGPILLTPVVLTEDALKFGMRFVREAKNRLLVSAWKPNSKHVWRYNTISRALDQVLLIPVEQEQTVGHVAVGNVDFDAEAELIVVAGPQSKPMVSVYTMTGQPKFQFMAYDATITSGLDVALVDANADGLLDIATVPVGQGSGHIKIFDYTGLTLREWKAYAPNFNLGATLSAADTNRDGELELIVGPGEGGGPHVKIFSLDGTLQHEFFAGDVGESSGAIVEFADIDHDQTLEYVVSYHVGHDSIIRTFNATGILQREYAVFAPNFRGAIGFIAL